MTLASITRQRIARWVGRLDLHGFVLAGPMHEPRSGQFAFLAADVLGYRASPATLGVREQWRSGPDPDGLGLEAEGCFLHGCSYDVRVDDRRSYRIDVDRSKPRSSILHTHPPGAPQSRVPLATLPTPEQILIRFETTILQRDFP